MKKLLATQKYFLLDFSSAMLQCLHSEPNPWRLIERGELDLADLLKADAIIKIRGLPENVHSVFSDGRAAKDWISKYRLQEQPDPRFSVIFDDIRLLSTTIKSMFDMLSMAVSAGNKKQTGSDSSES